LKPFSRSVIELFDGKKRYVIPMFQRQYVWNAERQLGRIWDDVLGKVAQRLNHKSTSPHFLGAIVISLLPTFGRQVQAYDVIDGQQRLTTFQILLNAFRDVALAMDSEFADELNKYIINDGIMEDKATECYKVWPTQVDREQMAALVNCKSKQELEVLEKTKLGRKVTGVEPIMIAAYRYFYDAISGFISKPYLETTPDERVEALFHALKHDLTLVSIELEGGDDPQVIFETLNGFNQPLLPTDLMRNFIFQRAYREVRTEDDKKPDELYNEYWLPFDKHFWKREEKQGRLKRPRVDLFYQHFLSMKFANDVNVGRLYYEYKNWIDTEKPYPNVEAELKETVKYAGIFKQIISFDEKTELTSFAEFLNIFDVKTIIPLILFIHGEKGVTGEPFKNCLNMLESFLVRRAICDLTTKNYNRLFLQLIDAIRDRSDIETSLRQELERGEGEAVVWPSDAMFSQAWLERSLYHQIKPSIRLQYILKKIEQAKRCKKSEEVEIRSALSIEHILPVSWYDYWSLADGRKAKPSLDRWLTGEVDEAADIRDKKLHTIGNLTLLTQPLNSSIKNAEWEIKKTEITAQSALTLNRELNAFESWNEQAIDERAKQLLSEALTIWSR
jgi:uncharacterized protein with ParB-like and HNH nuclease domain